MINLGRLQHLIDTGRIDPSQPITVKSLYDAGITNLQDGVKILAGVQQYVEINYLFFVLGPRIL